MNSFNSRKCIICKNNASSTLQGLDYTYNCRQCGTYVVSQPELLIIEEDLRPIISGYIREHQSHARHFELTQEVLDTIRTIPSITIKEKIHKLMLWFENKTRYPGDWISIDDNINELISTCYAHENREIGYLLAHLQDMKFISKKNGDNRYKITVDGFNYIESVRNTIKSNLCFCAMSFEDKHKYIYDDVIKPAATQAGFDIQRVDEAPHNDGIVDKIMGLIRQSKFVIADLSGNKHGVYYEAGFAKGLERPVIYTCEKAFFSKIHFDVRHLNFLKWDKSDITNTVDKLRWRIEGTIGRGSIT